MKALLICPADRPAVALLAEKTPLVLAPLLGKTLIEYWLEALVARGVEEVVVLASDRPYAMRALTGDGTRWGLRLELVPQSRELAVEEALRKFPIGNAVLLDHLPGLPQLPLFESYTGWFAALQGFLPQAISPDRIGAREVQPGVWIGMHTQVSPSARLQAPCWIGEHTVVGDGAVVGPEAILEDRVVAERGARVAHSVVGPETFVGKYISVQQSLASGSTIVNWKTNSCLHVPDAFFLCSLSERRFSLRPSSVLARGLAALAMLLTLPAAIIIMLISLLRGEAPLVPGLAVRPRRHVRTTALETFAYYELAAGVNWLRRWPQFWSVVRGDLNWIGNRPVRPTHALALGNDFERLWLAAPAGLVSLADAHGCIDEVSEETIAHASYYAVNASWRLNWFVLSRTFYRALAVWPVRRFRRKLATLAVPELVTK